MMKYNFESLFIRLNLLILIFLFSLSFFTVCLAGYNEKRLLHDLLDTYNTLERPVLNESDPLQLSFGLTLMQIIDVVSTIYIFLYLLNKIYYETLKLILKYCTMGSIAYYVY